MNTIYLILGFITFFGLIISGIFVNFLDKQTFKEIKMISQREVERQYNKLMRDVATDDYYIKVNAESRVNCYICTSKDCQHITKTKKLDPGVIPMMFDCEKCGCRAMSTYFKDYAPNQEPTIEWYRPTLIQVLKMRKRPMELEHILKGGLAYRQILDTPSVL